MLALHGADVLNIWRPIDFEIDLLYATASVGVRSTTLDVASAYGGATMRELLQGADVFYANRRAGFLDKVGLQGQTGSWADRSGFDQAGGCGARTRA